MCIQASHLRFVLIACGSLVVNYMPTMVSYNNCDQMFPLCGLVLVLEGEERGGTLIARQKRDNKIMPSSICCSCMLWKSIKILDILCNLH